MNEVLESLTREPGVRRALLVASDGVLIATCGLEADPHVAGSVAALAAGWMQDIRRAVDPMAWGAPCRCVMRAQRGSLVLLAAHDAILAVVLERGAAPEELRLPMEAAAARLGRHRDRPAPSMRRIEPALVAAEQPREPFPGTRPSPIRGAGNLKGTGDVFPESRRKD
jgi:predicted regulator of Ras-like GTPase activity (Roadblock/LC7/MglB family)